MWSFWLAFCNCDFLSGGCGIVILASSVCALMDEVKSLVRASWLERLTVGKQGLALVERAMISNILTQLSADGWGCALSPLVFWPVVTQPWNLQVTSKRTYDNMCLLCLPPPPKGLFSLWCWTTVAYQIIQFLEELECFFIHRFFTQ